MAHSIRRFLIRGKVQGVFFRHSARIEAQRLGVRGFARNLPDGSVEVVACGPAAQVAALRSWLEHGPTAARVDEVEDAPSDAQLTLGEDFVVR